MKTKLMAVVYVLWGMFISLCFLPVLWESPPGIFITLYIPIVVITFLLSVFVLAEAYISGMEAKKLESGLSVPGNVEDSESDDGTITI